MNDERVRADLDQAAWLLPDEFVWEASPQPGVERVKLDRVGGEVAVATSLVRYAAGSAFPPHGHPLGEEYIVLEGEFADEHGRHPAGTYVRNPPGSHHTPYSDPGCLIFVKLRQMATDDARHQVEALNCSPPAVGWASHLLHAHGRERVWSVRAAAGERVVFPGAFDGYEVLVLQGAVRWQWLQTFEMPVYSWIRIPPGHPLRLNIVEPSVLYVKRRPAT